MGLASRTLLSIAGLLVSSAALAQSGSDAALAEALFLEAQQLMEQGQRDEACKKFASSHRLDPAGGTVLNLAVCFEESGKTASAWALYKEAITLARRDGRADREQLAASRLAELEGRVPTLAVDVPAAANLPALVLTLDGARLDREVWGSPFPVDPGPHVLVALAPGRKSVRLDVVAEAGTRRDLTVPPLDVVPRPLLSPAARKPHEEPGTDPKRVAGLAAIGLGVVGVGVGVGFGIRAIVKENEARDLRCVDELCPKGGGKAASDASGASAEVSNGGFIVGVVGLAVGTILVLTSRPSAKSRSMVRVDGAAGAVRIGGSF